MKIDDFDGTLESDDVEDFVDRIRCVRRDGYGAFHISGRDDYPYLALHVNGDAAYLHYFPHECHPGFQPNATDEDRGGGDVHFLNLDGAESDAFDVPPSTLVSLDDAINAVHEFASNGELPPSIAWLEL